MYFILPAGSTRYLEIIEEDNLLENVRIQGKFLMDKLNGLQENYPKFVSNIRGRGVFCAFDMPSQEIRDSIVGKCFENGLMILSCGPNSIRFRPPLDVKQEHLEYGINILENAIKTL